jgi:hypothetical protein
MKLRLLALTLTLATTVLAQQTPADKPPAAQSSTTGTLAKIEANDPSTKKARALLDKMIAALGGDAYMNYSTMTQYGRAYSFYQGQPNSSGVRFWRFWKYPDKDRFELTKQRDVIDIYNGDNGYEITYKGTASIEPKDLREYIRRRNYSMEIVLREWLKDPATLIFYDGSGLAEQRYVEKVTLLNKNNDSVTIGIDPDTYLPLKKSYTYRDPFDGLKSTDDEIYANYRLVQGIQTPFNIVRYHNGLQSAQRFINDVQYNVPIADTMFEAKVTYDMYKLNQKKK